MTYDLIIIGGGPAGAAAAVYAARKQLKTLLIAEEWGGQSIVSEKIYNWIGTPEISGPDLAKSLKSHVDYYIGDFLQTSGGERVEKLEKNGGFFSVKTNSGNAYEARAVLIASGSSRKKLPAAVLGADRLEHKGLTYCASCDGPLFSDQDVVVLGGGNAALETAAQLLAYCKSVTIIIRGKEFRADEITVAQVLKDPKAKAIMNAEITEIVGEKFVSAIKYKNAEGEQTLPVTGIFVEIGQIPNTNFAEGLVEMNDHKQVKIDPRTQMTSLPGVWASGDCTDVLYHQNNIAAGDAVRALEDIYQYLHRNK